MKTASAMFGVTRFIATGFGLGFLRPAPGTWGSLGALFLAIPLYTAGGRAMVLAAVAFAAAATLLVAPTYANATGRRDPSEVVIDEFAGMWLTLAFVPFTAAGAALAFLLFRLLDIVKPWPISLANDRLDGGIGILADDLVAGLLAGPLALAILWGAERLPGG